MGVLPLHRRVPEAARLAQTVATAWLTGDRSPDAAAWAVRASDLLDDFADDGAVASLQRAAGAALCALAIELHRGRSVPPKELARAGEIVASEALELIDGEIARLDAAIRGAPRGAKKPLYQRRSELRREKQRICAALREKTLKEAL